MERAAEMRFWDGLMLAANAVGHRLGAVYLLGYTAEMLLKTAYFRYAGVPAGNDIAPYLRTVRAHLLWTGRNLHDLQSWLDFLLNIRHSQGNPIAPAFAGLARIQILAIDVHWRESLRYASLQPTEQELNQVYESVEWLRNNHALLWR